MYRRFGLNFEQTAKIGGYEKFKEEYCKTMGYKFEHLILLLKVIYYRKHLIREEEIRNKVRKMRRRRLIWRIVHLNKMIYKITLRMYLSLIIKSIIIFFSTEIGKEQQLQHQPMISLLFMKKKTISSCVF